MKYLKGFAFGIVAGFIDVIPMILQKLTWDANLSAFSMWTIIGFLISAVNIKMNSILKGIFISFLVLIPSAILIGWKEPFSLLPISIMTLILGSSLGYVINKVTK
ncbi:MAG: hypothetical protein GYA14_06735 [Ignavibacteria bacterium]|nr:hypothetical protein [Ignavibacteria bacterium]